MYNSGITLKMSNSSLLSGGYADSNAISCMTNLYNQLQISNNSLYKAIKESTILYNNGADICELTTHLFIASTKKIGYTGYGEKFDYFDGSFSTVAKLATDANITSVWWLRTSFNLDKVYFTSLGTLGTDNVVPAENEHAIVPCFVIG